MAPQREGGDEEERTARPKLATSLQAGSGSSCERVIVGETACSKRPLEGEVREGLKEGSACEMDNELTSLTWLQNCDLLQGLQRSLGDVGESASGSSKTLLSPLNNKTSGVNAGADETYNPTVHRHAKPPFSFSCLIFMAIEDSPSKALPVKDIYNWIFSHFPYFRNAPNGWRNSIRHNLSLSKCFYKVDKGQNLAKGSLWCVDPKYRHHLLHSLNKTPNAHYHQGVRLPTFNPPPPTPKNDVILDFKETEEEMTSPPALPSTNSTSGFQYPTKKMNVKNPEEDAAVTMLALKNGSVLTTPIVRTKDTPTVLRINKRSVYADDHLTRINEDSRVSCEIHIPASLPVLTNVPNKDHTYSTTGDSEEETEVKMEQPLELTTKPRPALHRWERTLSPILVAPDFRKKRKLRSEARYVRRKRRREEAFGAEEHKKIVDGADALLNLAGIVTGGAPKGEERPMRRQRKPSKIHLRHLVGPPIGEERRPRESRYYTPPM